MLFCIGALMSNPALFKLTKPTGGLRHAWFQIITRFLLCFAEDDRPCLDGLWFKWYIIDTNVPYWFIIWSIHWFSDIDECNSFPCRNGGNCIDEVNRYSCQCPSGWTGTHCEVDINECASNPCLNGNCVNGVNQYFCNCQAGWTGTNCDQSKSYAAINGYLELTLLKGHQRFNAILTSNPEVYKFLDWWVFHLIYFSTWWIFT